MKEKFLHSQGCIVRYTISGASQGPWIVLLHGWGCSADTMVSIGRVAGSTHRVLAIDFPGHGGSEEPPGIWGVEEYTQAVSDIMEHENILRPVMLGHSFGGRVCILFASMYPENVEKLVLVDAAGIKPRRTLRYYVKVYSFKAMKFTVRLLFSKDRAERMINARRAKSGSADYASASPVMRAVLSKVVNQDLKKLIPDVKAPALLIWGENDTATPLSDAKYMERHMPNSGLVSFPGCGHYSFLDNPVQFAAVLRSFLNS
ncbi:alpha/beta fold hydrolase [uncultured Muribaculum sp.]|uniref:alpha/beta fold hydrolase n=2 Tax=uncultured Muribaculum sp. TaxID=1918613 RepID=UPI0026701863|nr:alpha/beta hydrolase [uncultured Muribaculum sp.]